MSNNVIQTSFSAGELSPTLYARVDLAKFHIGAALMKNFFVDYRGGASTRPGFQFIARAIDSTKPTRLIPFQFSTIQNYVLEFGNFTMRVIKAGGLITLTPINIAAISQANPGVITTGAPHGLSNGDQVTLSISGMFQLNNGDFFVVVIDSLNFRITNWAGVTIDTTNFGAFTAGTMAKIYVIPSPYAAADLALLKYTQSADVMTICHPNYAPRNLSRTSDTGWTFSTINITSTINAPVLASVVVAPATAGATNYSYVVTAVDSGGQESIASNIVGSLNNINIQTTAGSVTITWAAVAGAAFYNVYKALPATNSPIPAGSLYGYMTTVTGVSAVDANIVPDFTFAPPTHQNPFINNNPSAVTYDQQRLVFAASLANPETFWMSKPGQFTNFDISNPVQPSDSITGTLVSRQVNNIKFMVPMPGGLIMLTGGGAWQVSGGSSGAVISPATITATPQAYNGCSDVEPLTINEDILYVQQKGTVVRDLSYSFYTNIYTGADISVWANHFFTGFTIVQWAYAEEPFKIVWAIRNDGKLLSLTYLKEQQVSGWAQHSTQGRFVSITTIQEGAENAVYVAVQRFLQGQLITLNERMHSRIMPYGAEDAWFIDSGLSNDLVYPNAILQPAAIEGTAVNFNTNMAVFMAGSVGSVIRAGGGIATVKTFIDANNVLCDITQAITDVDEGKNSIVVWPQQSGSWSLTAPITVLTGLGHLEGEVVTILGDGNVFPNQTVISGTVILSQPCTKITVGLGYTADLQTLYLDTGEPTIQGKRKFISAMTARVDQTRGISMGPTFDDLIEFKDRDLQTIGQPIGLFTGDQRVGIEDVWQEEGQMCIRQAYPLPATILGVIPEITLGDTGK